MPQKNPIRRAIDRLDLGSMRGSAPLVLGLIRKNPKRSNRWIAQKANVSHTMVGKIKRKYLGYAQGESIGLDGVTRKVSIRNAKQPTKADLGLPEILSLLKKELEKMKTSRRIHDRDKIIKLCSEVNQVFESLMSVSS